MKKVLEKVLSPQVFAICYLPWLAINMVTVINIMEFTRIFLALFAVWAVAICVKLYFFSGKGPWIHKSVSILLLFLAACLVSQVLNFSYGGLDSVGKFCYFALCIVLLYSQYQADTMDYVGVLKVLVRILGIVIGIMILVSDWMFVDIFSATIEGRSGVTVNVGFTQNRLFGVFSSPNVGGTFALILIWCSFLTLKWVKTMRCRVLWIVLSIVQIVSAAMYISVALSRGTYISGIVLIVSYLLIRAPFEKEKMLSAWKQCLIRVISIAAAVIVCIVGIQGMNTLSCEAMEWNYERKIANEPPENVGELSTIVENAQQGSAGRVEAGRDDIDISNKRFSIWKAHLELLEGERLIVGVNNPLAYLESQVSNGKTFSEDQLTYVRYANGNLHNGYLQVLVNGGLLALLPLLVFLLLCVVKAFRFAGGTLLTRKRSTDTKAYELFSLSFPVVLMILVNNVFETNFVLMGANFIQAFFWFIAGVCVQSMQKEEQN